VDDSAIARKAARIPLETEGYTVVEATDGFEALGQMQNEEPDLVLLDLIMPGIDGYRVLDLIRGNPAYAKVPVIMLTARDGLIDRLKGRMSDLDGYLTKPFEPFDLIREVARHLQK
jgi:CheY-like chemotaxis protein